MNNVRSKTAQAAHYPTRSQIARAVQAARANGVSVGIVDVQRDGTIRVSSNSKASKPAVGSSLFDELNAAGCL